MDGREIELKLGMSPDDIALLSLSPPLSLEGEAPPPPRRLASIYFDTPDFTLAASGVSLRVRWTGDGLVQTVKVSGNGGAGLFDRPEWEQQLERPVPDPGHLRATGLAVFADDGLIGQLEPVFSTQVNRTIFRLGGIEHGWEVEAALDQGEVVAGSLSEPICEVELELVRGSPDRLFRLARQVLDTVPARPLSISKSERGVKLATGDTNRPVKARVPLIRPDLTAAAAFQTIARSCLDHLLVNERCLLATGDAEAIHQMRVALRRLRSAVRVFRPLVASPRLAEVKSDLRWLLERLGPARDAEVFLSDIIDPVVQDYPDDPGLTALRDYWRSDRDARLDAAVSAVRDRRFAALVLDLTAWVEAGDWLGAPGEPLRRKLEAPIGPFALRRLGKTTRRMLRQGGDSLSRLTPEERHAVRILCKQTRYTAEFFAALVPRKQMKVFLGELAEVQDALGRLNDIAVAAPKLAAGSNGSGRHARAAGLVAGWHTGRQAGMLAEAERAWKRVRARDLPWSEE
jgi:inorganic triphosphatase YgiF